MFKTLHVVVCSLIRSLQGTILSRRLQLEVVLMHALHSKHTLLAEHRLALGLNNTSEEAGLPVEILRLTLGRPFALSLFQLCLEVRRFGELLVRDGLCDVVPEAARLVGQLVFGRRANFGHGEEGRDVDEEHAVLLVRLLEVLGAVGEPDLVLPAAVDAAEDVLFGHVLDAADVVLFDVCFVDYALDLVLRLAKVAFLDVVEDDLDSCLLAGHEASVGDGDVEVAAEEAAEICGGVGETVGLVVVAVQLDVDALVVLAGDDADGSSGELGGELIKAHC
jgi:hypothetical protein